jgi:hypothetical protein
VTCNKVGAFHAPLIPSIAWCAQRTTLLSLWERSLIAINLFPSLVLDPGHSMTRMTRDEACSGHRFLKASLYH